MRARGRGGSRGESNPAPWNLESPNCPGICCLRLPPPGWYCVQGQYVSPRVTNLLLQYVTQAIAYSHTWKALKPHIEQILLR